MRRILLMGCAATLAACGGGDGDCVTEVGAGGRLTIAAGSICVRDASVRVRSGGAWSDGGAAVDVELVETDGGALVTLVADAPVEAFELVIPRVAADRMLQQGYQSWSFSGVIEIPDSVPMDGDGEPAFPAPATGEVFDEALGVSYGSAVLADGAESDALVIGAASAHRANSGVAAFVSGDGAEVRVVYGVSREPLPADGGRVTSEPIAFLSAGSATDGLALLAAEMKAANPGPEPERPPGGWFSWNQHFEEIDQQLIRDHADFARTELAPAGMTLVEIDDGWMVAWGDWQENDQFADSLETLAGEITGAGLVAGIWLAPFLVDADSLVAATIDRDYLVKDAEGAPIVHKFSGATRSYFVLDGANPAAMQVATDAIARLRSAGFRFFKLDFLYAGAFPGQRSQEVTGVEAFRSGMELLREAAGSDAVINACGVPIVPVLGLADSLRVGADTAFTTPDLDWSMVAYAARSYAARSFLAPLIWPDADQVQLREPYSLVEAESGAATAALAGPAYSLGDDLTLLPADRLAIAMDETILDLAAGEPAQPVDLMATPATEVVTSPGIEAVRYPGWTEAPPPRRFRATGGSGTEYLVEIDWQGDHGVTITPE